MTVLCQDEHVMQNLCQIKHMDSATAADPLECPTSCGYADQVLVMVVKGSNGLILAVVQTPHTPKAPYTEHSKGHGRMPSPIVQNTCRLVG